MRHGTEPLGEALHTAYTGPADPDLVRLVEVWPTLSEPIRLAILATGRFTTKDEETLAQIKDMEARGDEEGVPEVLLRKVGRWLCPSMESRRGERSRCAAMRSIARR